MRPGQTGSLLPAHDPEAVLSTRALKPGDLLVHDSIMRHLRGPVMAAWAADVARETDAMLGLRLHGNIIAPQQGRPALLLLRDARTREIAEGFSMPRVEVAALDRARLDAAALLAGLDRAGFPAAQRAGFAAYRTLPEENGIAHRLTPAAPLTPGGETA